MWKRLVCTLFFIISYMSSFCQSGFQSSIKAIRRQNVEEIYKQTNVTHVLTGRDYQLKYLYAVNSQFFNDQYPSKGSLVYDGILFPDITIQYDLYAQKVVVLLESNTRDKYISINNSGISKFSIGNSCFVNLPGDSIITKGIYQESFAGHLSTLYVKRIKIKRETIENKRRITWKFSSEDRYFIRNRFGTFEISNKKEFINAFHGSEQLIEILKKYKIRTTRRKLENGIMEALQYMDVLPEING